MIGDDPAPLGSASNPIMTHVDEEWCHDDKSSSGEDTDIMSTPKFWESLTHDYLAIPADECADTDPPTVPPACEGP